jgi:flagellar basal body-associated protein FliL
VAKTQMTRFLLAEIVVVSGKSNIKDLVEAHEPELRNAAINVMCTKTIADLELPTARNLIRSELMSNFGPILGDGVVKDIYLTDFAVQ